MSVANEDAPFNYPHLRVEHDGGEYNYANVSISWVVPGRDPVHLECAKFAHVIETNKVDAGVVTFEAPEIVIRPKRAA